MTNGKSVDPKHDNEKVSIASLDAWLYELVKRVNTLEASHKAEINMLKDTISKQTDTINELTTRLNEMPIPTPPEFNDEIKETVIATARELTMSQVVSSGLDNRNNLGVQVVAALNNEQREKVKREKNIIVFGLEAAGTTDDDKTSIYQLINTLNVNTNDIENAVRLNNARNNNTRRPHPVLVTLKSSAIRENALKSAKELKNHDIYKKISISPDLMPNERLALKSEVDECKKLNLTLLNAPYYWGIRNGVKRKIDRHTKRFYKEPANQQALQQLSLGNDGSPTEGSSARSQAV